MKKTNLVWDMNVPMSIGLKISLADYELINKRVNLSVKYWLEVLLKNILWDSIALVIFSLTWLVFFMYYTDSTVVQEYLDIGLICGLLNMMIVHALFAGFKIPPFSDHTHNKYFLIEFQKYFGTDWSEYVIIHSQT